MRYHHIIAAVGLFCYVDHGLNCGIKTLTYIHITTYLDAEHYQHDNFKTISNFRSFTTRLTDRRIRYDPCGDMCS